MNLTLTVNYKATQYVTKLVCYPTAIYFITSVYSQKNREVLARTEKTYANSCKLTDWIQYPAIAVLTESEKQIADILANN